MIRGAFFLVVVVGALACRAESHTDPASARRAIDSLQTRLETWTAAGQADSIAGAFTEDGWQMTPNGPPLVGRDSIRSFWARSFKNGQWKLEEELAELRGADSLAVTRGTFTINFSALPQSPIQSFGDSGNQLTVWRLGNDGVWRIQWRAVASTVRRGPPIPAPAGTPPRQ